MVAGLAASIQNRRVVDLHELRRLILSLHSCECPDSERLACIYPGNKLDYICLYPHSGNTSTFMECHQRNQRTQGLLRTAFIRHCTDIVFANLSLSMYHLWLCLLSLLPLLLRPKPSAW